jgi:hypothetical protein
MYSNSGLHGVERWGANRKLGRWAKALWDLEAMTGGLVGTEDAPSSSVLSGGCPLPGGFHLTNMACVTPPRASSASLGDLPSTPTPVALPRPHPPSQATMGSRTPHPVDESTHLLSALGLLGQVITDTPLPEPVAQRPTQAFRRKAESHL